MKLLIRGNAKLDKSILCWSITPIKSCLNHSQCYKTCYAMKAYRQYPNTKTAWDRNFALAKSGEFKTMVIEQIDRSRTVKIVRIHVAGDFFSVRYINNWKEIILKFPDIQFYGYSKVFKRYGNELESLNTLPNCNIINSIADDGGLNYGDIDRVNKLIEHGHFHCPVHKNGEIVCGKDCSYCAYKSKPCFTVH